MKQTLFTLSLITAVTLLLSCGAAVMPRAEAQHEHSEIREMQRSQLPGFRGVNDAVAVVHPTADNDAHGTVRFHHHEDGHVIVTARIEGLAPNSSHGFHIHEFGDCSAADGTSAGGHYNPGDHPHALPNGDERHAGDLGNLEANDEGVAELELTVDNITLAGVPNPIVGRGVIVHQQEDDGSQPTGNAGARIGCGVIGVAQGE
ncbi:MAG: superoxide dismutase family protein [Phycisphaeraceae bacterium]